MEPIQILLFSVVLILTTILVAVGVQIFLTLKKLQESVSRVNKILDDVNLISSSIAKPVAGFANFVDGLKNAKNIFDAISERTIIGRIFKTENNENIHVESYEEPQTAHSHIEDSQQGRRIEELQERGRRFFHRDGKTLTS